MLNRLIAGLCAAVILSSTALTQPVPENRPTSARELALKLIKSDSLDTKYTDILPRQIQHALGLLDHNGKRRDDQIVFSRRTRAGYILGTFGHELARDAHVVSLQPGKGDASQLTSWTWRRLALPYLSADGTIVVRDAHERLSWNDAEDALQATECTDVRTGERQFVCARTLYRLTWNEIILLRMDATRDRIESADWVTIWGPGLWKLPEPK